MGAPRALSDGGPPLISQSGQVPFDNRDGWIWLDGELVAWRDAKVHVLTHALHYASSVFEGERAYGGTIFKLREHSERLSRSANLLGFDLPWNVSEIDSACLETLAANDLTDAYVRPIAWCGTESMGITPGDGPPHLAIAAWNWGRYFDPALERTGIRLDLAPWRRPAPHTAPCEAKAAGLYMICMLSKKHAERRGFQDALMLDSTGRIAEATGANIFFVSGGALHTPATGCFLDGITRRTVIDLARERGIEVVERAIWPEELESFEQAFLTGTAAEVTSIRSIGPWNFETGGLANRLAAAYQDLVRGRLVPPAADLSVTSAKITAP